MERAKTGCSIETKINRQGNILSLYTTVCCVMSDPKNLSIKNYSYHLPEDRIAKYALAERDASKLLIYESGRITQDIYKYLSDHLPFNSLLLFNDTKVIEARLFFQKATGGVIEVFC